MNHAEAAAFAEQLDLIWETRPRPELEGKLWGPHWRLFEDEEGYWDFYFKGTFGDNMTVTMRSHPIDGTRIEVHFLGDHDGDLQSESESYGEVRWDRHGHFNYSSSVSLAVFNERTKPWMDTLRRNTFLSGCPVDTTFHEQLEWPLWLKEQHGTVV